MAQTSEENVVKNTPETNLPSIHAIFLVTFDNRKGCVKPAIILHS